MPGLSRRHFLTGVAALAAATGLNIDVLGRGLVARAQTTAQTAASIPTTLQQTILQGSVIQGSYRGLVTGAVYPSSRHPASDALERTHDGPTFAAVPRAPL